MLVALAVCRSPRACAIGIAVALETTLWLVPLVALGAFLVPAYNLELLGGRVHTDLGFALAWGAFPVVTAFVAQAATIRWRRSSRPCGRRSSRSRSRSGAFRPRSASVSARGGRRLGRRSARGGGSPPREAALKLLAALRSRSPRRSSRLPALTTGDGAAGSGTRAGPAAERGQREDGRSEPADRDRGGASAAANAMPAETATPSRRRAP